MVGILWKGSKDSSWTILNIPWVTGKAPATNKLVNARDIPPIGNRESNSKATDQMKVFYMINIKTNVKHPANEIN